MFGKELLAHVLDRIRVAHEHDWRLGIALPELGHHAKHGSQSDALRNRVFGRSLDHRPIGHRIGERDAQLDDVRTGLDQGVHQGNGRLGQRVARRDIRNERSATLACCARKGRSDAVLVS